MRWALRFAFSASIILIIALLVLKNILQDLADQYSVGTYVKTSWDSFGTVQNDPIFRGKPGDKIIVMAKLEKENTDWVNEMLGDWQAAIYTVNPSPSSPSTDLTTPMNKGHEAMAYLSYIISNYKSLPSTLAFIHSHHSGFLAAWHTDTPLHDNVAALRSLQESFVQSNGYVNLRCNWNPGCEMKHRNNKHVTKEVWEEVFSGTSTEGTPYPGQVGAGCCAQFAVSREQVLRRPLSDYEKLRQWVVETEQSDAKSGRVLEFLWHAIFGKEGVYCPEEQKCYCDVRRPTPTAPLYTAPLPPH